MIQTDLDSGYQFIQCMMQACAQVGTQSESLAEVLGFRCLESDALLLRFKQFRTMAPIPSFPRTTINLTGPLRASAAPPGSGVSSAQFEEIMRVF